jgi:hypothetical protein
LPAWQRSALARREIRDLRGGAALARHARMQPVMVCEVVAPASRHRFAKHVLLVVLLLGIGYGLPYRFHREQTRMLDDLRRAYLQAGRFAVIAHAQWMRDHPTGGCPASFTELRRYAKDPSPIDPWGGVFEMVCEPTLLRVHSPGPDGVFGTADDIERTAPR